MFRHSVPRQGSKCVWLGEVGKCAWRAIPIAVFLFIARPVVAATANADMEARLQRLTDQVTGLQKELAQIKAQRITQPATLPETSRDAAAVTPSLLTPNAAEYAANGGSAQFSGYGEIGYSRPRHGTSDTTADVGRYVIGMGYRFDDKTRLFTELEVEHAVSSSSDPGEVEVEQAYIEREFGNDVFAKAGLFLIPSGLLNEAHEPPRYYGVFRNVVETAIIPTTWREGGVIVQGRTEGGLRWDIGATTGFDLSKWNATSTEGQESPLRSIHQELALARAKQLSGVAALNYSGIAGVTLGASLFAGGAGQGQDGYRDAKVMLWEGHARWAPGRWDLTGLYAQGHISGTQKINETLVGNPTLIPQKFFGWYLQSAFRVYEAGSKSLTPFVRYERFNTASRYASIGAGLTPDELQDQKVWTVGFNFIIAPGVVLKADYLDFDDAASGDRFDLGIGYQF